MKLLALKDFIFLPVSTTQLRPVLASFADIPDATIVQVPVDLLAHIVINRSNESTSPVIISSSPTLANPPTTSSLVAQVHGTLVWKTCAKTGTQIIKKYATADIKNILLITRRKPFGVLLGIITRFL